MRLGYVLVSAAAVLLFRAAGAQNAISGEGAKLEASTSLDNAFEKQQQPPLPAVPALLSKEEMRQENDAVAPLPPSETPPSPDKEIQNLMRNNEDLRRLSATACPSNSGDTCFECPPGQRADKGQNLCVACDAGTFSVGNQLECTKCRKGYFSAAGAASCTPCPAGTYHDTEGKLMTTSSRCLARMLKFAKPSAHSTQAGSSAYHVQLALTHGERDSSSASRVQRERILRDRMELPSARIVQMVKPRIPPELLPVRSAQLENLRNHIPRARSAVMGKYLPLVSIHAQTVLRESMQTTPTSHVAIVQRVSTQVRALSSARIVLQVTFPRRALPPAQLV